MEQKERWLDWCVRLQALAQAGLHYGKDAFDLERYQEIRNIAAEMMSEGTGLPVEKVQSLFCNDSGYQTPKIDTRAAIFEDGKILLVHEAAGKSAVYAYKICKIFVECEVLGGAFQPNSETSETRYFSLDELPPLAEEKNTREQIEMCFRAMQTETWETLID